MKLNPILCSILAAGLVAGAAVFAAAGQANTLKTDGAAVTVAQASPQAVAKKRGSLMKAMNRPWKRLTRAAKKGNIGANEVAQAEKIAGNLKQLQGLFGDRGTANDKVKGRAKPAIWKNMADFDKRMAEAVMQANAGVMAAKAGNANGVAAAMKAVGCNSCHKRYRGKKPK